MEQSPSREPFTSSACQEIPDFLRALKFYYHVHKDASPVPALCLINAVHNVELFQYCPPIHVYVFQGVCLLRAEQAVYEFLQL